MKLICTFAVLLGKRKEKEERKKNIFVTASSYTKGLGKVFGSIVTSSLGG